MFKCKSFNFFVAFFLMAVGLLLASCASDPSVFDQDEPKTDEPKTDEPKTDEPKTDEIYPKTPDKTPDASTTTHTVEPPAYLLEVEDPNSDKIYVFTDLSSYRDYRRKGKLPSGKEVKVGSTVRVLVDVPEDRPLDSIGVYLLYQRKLQPRANFYVQRLVNNPTPSFYVFSSPDLLNTPVADLPMQQSEPDGPNGELVNYSLQGTDFHSLQIQFWDIND
jgi:hypothetical protein